MFATTYRHIIKHHLAPFIRKTYGNEKCFLIQDNDGKHASDICIDELKKQNIHWVKNNLNTVLLSILSHQRDSTVPHRTAPEPEMVNRA